MAIDKVLEIIELNKKDIIPESLEILTPEPEKGLDKVPGKLNSDLENLIRSTATNRRKRKEEEPFGENRGMAAELKIATLKTRVVIPQVVPTRSLRIRATIPTKASGTRVTVITTKETGIRIATEDLRNLPADQSRNRTKGNLLSWNTFRPAHLKGWPFFSNTICERTC